jgi:hypothetical protein
MASPLKIIADSKEGKHFEITLEQTETDAVMMRLATWNSNPAAGQAPDKDDTLGFYDIRFDQSRRLICRARMNGSNPLITLTLNPARDDAAAYLRMILGDTFAGFADGIKDLPLEKPYFDGFKQFLMAAKFPLIEASVIKNEKTVLRRD